MVLVQKAGVVKKGLDATGFQGALVMRALVLLHTTVRTATGGPLLPELSYPYDAPPTPTPEGIERAEAYLQKHGMHAVLERFRKIVLGH